MQWGTMQTSWSHSSSTSLPCNFSVECPTHPPHITVLSLTPPTPQKTLHASIYTATQPKYTAPPLSLLQAACSDTLYAHTTLGFPLSVVDVCVCVNVLQVHPTVYLPPPPSSLCETSRKASIILMTITTCISICWPQMSWRAAVRMDSERAPKERRKQRQETLGPLSGDPLPTQGSALSTPAHTRLQRHTDDSREAVF